MENNQFEGGTRNFEDLVNSAQSFEELIAIIQANNMNAMSAGKMRSAEELAKRLNDLNESLVRIDGQGGPNAQDDKKIILAEAPRAFGIRKKIAEFWGIDIQDLF